MSRNRYTKLVHQEQRAQLARQEKVLAIFARELHGKIAEPAATPDTNDNKQRRRTRLERKQWRSKSASYAIAFPAEQVSQVAVEAAA
jgi:hypothetical protein